MDDRTNNLIDLHADDPGIKPMNPEVVYLRRLYAEGPTIYKDFVEGCTTVRMRIATVLMEEGRTHAKLFALAPELYRSLRMTRAILALSPYVQEFPETIAHIDDMLNKIESGNE